MEEITDEQLTNVNSNDVQISMPILGNPTVEDAEPEADNDIASQNEGDAYETEAMPQSQAEDAEPVSEEISQEQNDEKPIESVQQEIAQDTSGTEENTDQVISDDSTPESEKQEPDTNILNILDAIDSLSQKVDDLGKKFDARIMHTDGEEKVIDRMHDELIKYKGDMYSQLLRPILLDLIDMRDSINRMTEVYASKPEGEQAVPLSSFTTYSDDLEEILTKNNINIYRSKEGEPLVPLRQRPVKKVPTPVKELNGKVAEIASDGYEYLGKVISPEKVAVYVYQETEKKEGEE
jgi:molecular chaperone GrpE (heat shock protein)